MRTIVGCVGFVGSVVMGLACTEGDGPSGTALVGVLRGPVGDVVVLGDGTSTTSATVEGTLEYGAVDVSFAATEGDAFAITVADAPEGRRCEVYAGATGTVPAATPVRVGCEHRFDHVSRDEAGTLATVFETASVVIGGDGIVDADAVGGSDGSTAGEGRYVAFVSYARGLAGATDAHRQIFWRDRWTGETRLVSVTPTGDEGDGDSFEPAISQDGRTVAFESYASDLAPSDANRVRDVFVWSADTDEVRRVSETASGADGDGESYAPTIDGDGSVVAFTSQATNLTSTDVGRSSPNVVRIDLATGERTLVSVAAVGDDVGLGAGGDRASLSADGSRLAFWSFGAELVAGDTNGLWDIFVYDHRDGSVRRVSVTSSGGERDQGTESVSRIVTPTISGDGRFVVYATTARDVVPGDEAEHQDVFLVALDDGSVTCLSEGGDGDSPIGQGERIALSHDGARAAFTTRATNLGVPQNDVVLVSTTTGARTAGSAQTTGSVTVPSISTTGAYLAFGSSVPLDVRFTSSGMFVRFTEDARAFFWGP